MAKKAQAINFDFSQGIVKKGTKVSESNTPELALDSSYCKFSLNTKARELMGVHTGDHVIMYDMQLMVDEQANRFYISKIDYKVGDKALGAIIGKSNSFNFSGVYNSILANDMAKKDTIQRDLMADGLLAATKYDDGTVKYISLKKGIMTLELVGEKTIDLADMFGVKDTIKVDVYSLGTPLFVDHDPQAKGTVYTDYAQLGGEVVDAELESVDVEEVEA